MSEASTDGKTWSAKDPMEVAIAIHEMCRTVSATGSPLTMCIGVGTGDAVQPAVSLWASIGKEEPVSRLAVLADTLATVTAERDRLNERVALADAEVAASRALLMVGEFGSVYLAMPMDPAWYEKARKDYVEARTANGKGGAL